MKLANCIFSDKYLFNEDGKNIFNPDVVSNIAFKGDPGMGKSMLIQYLTKYTGMKEYTVFGYNLLLTSFIGLHLSSSISINFIEN